MNRLSRTGRQKFESTVIPWVSMGDWFQDSPDPQIRGCSHPLYKMVWDNRCSQPSAAVDSHLCITSTVSDPQSVNSVMWNPQTRRADYIAHVHI